MCYILTEAPDLKEKFCSNGGKSRKSEKQCLLPAPAYERKWGGGGSAELLLPLYFTTNATGPTGMAAFIFQGN